MAREARPALRRQLKGLAASGDLVVTRGGLYGLPEKMDLVAGRLLMHSQGYGFVEDDVRFAITKR